MPGYELINHNEVKALKKVFSDKKNFISKNKVLEFSNLIKKKTKSKYCQLVTSGTAAIKIALKAVGVKRGDEVITQAFNFIATVEAIYEIGAKPIIANIDDTLNMCPIDLKKKISKKTKAIIPVHMLGVPCNMTEIMKISKKYSIPVVEDNCESFGGFYKNKMLGTIGDVGILSFDIGKSITTCEGGAIITNNKKIYLYSNEYQDHGHENNPKFPRGMDTISITGFNYRFTQLQAVVGIVQIRKLNLQIKDNQSKYKILKNILDKKFKERKIPKSSISLNDCYIFKFKSNNEKIKIIKTLKKFGIGTKNLPDAIKWHCASYWDLMISKDQIQNIKYSLNLLKKHIAIPIFFSKSKKFYKDLACELAKIS